MAIIGSIAMGAITVRYQPKRLLITGITALLAGIIGTSLSTSFTQMTLFFVLYGVGTALPVLLFAVLIALGAQWVGRAFNVLSKIEWWARVLTGSIFLIVGVYFSLKYIFEVI